MGYDYSYGYDYGYELGEEFGAAIAIFYVVYMLISFGLGLAQYILHSAGIHTIAKRRGISHAWLAWIPVASVWVLGSISDQYRYVVKGQIKSKRKVLLTLMIIALVIGIVASIAMMGGIVGLAFDEGSYVMDDSAAAASAGFMLGGVFLMLIVAGISIAAAIIYYMALYDLFTSIKPNYNVVFLVLSIIFRITEPFFIFCNRKSDEGMPPRTDAPVNPVYHDPVYLPPQEPWEDPEN